MFLLEFRNGKVGQWQPLTYGAAASDRDRSGGLSITAEATNHQGGKGCDEGGEVVRLLVAGVSWCIVMCATACICAQYKSLLVELFSAFTLASASDRCSRPENDVKPGSKVR